MTVVAGATWAGLIATKDATGALMAATVGPVGVLYVNGVADAAVVTVAGVNPYSWSVVLPALADGDCVSMYITATVDGVATAGIVAEDVASTVYLSSRSTLAQADILSDATPFAGANIDAAITSRAAPGDAMTLTGAERTTLAGVIWTHVDRTLTSFGNLVRDIVRALSGTVIAILPVARGGNVVTYQGDAYQNATGRAIDWTSTTWPNLTGATIAVYVGGLTFAGAVIAPLGNQRVRLELTGAQTATIPTNVRRFQVVATLAAGGGPATLVEARWDSRSRPQA
jgi:hypothetical protein